MYISILISGDFRSFAFLSRQNSYVSKYFPKHCSKISSCNTLGGYPRGEMKVREWLQRGHGKSQWLLQTSSLLSCFLIEQQPELCVYSDWVGICMMGFQQGKCEQHLIYNNCWGLSLGINSPAASGYKPLPSHGSRDRAHFGDSRAGAACFPPSEMSHRTPCPGLEP